MRGWITVILIILVIGLLLWAPWLTPERAMQRAVQGFERAWQGVMDGCGFNCQGCGALEAARTLIGYRVTLEYACGMRPADDPQDHQRAEVLVSPLGTLHGLPRP